jgi:hypothetical protein
MIRLIKFLGMSLAVLMTVLLVACGDSGGSSGDEGTKNPDQGAADDERFVSNIGEVIAGSVQSFEGEDVSSMSGDVQFNFAMGTMEMSGDATFAVQSPDQMHMQMKFEGGDGQSMVDLSELGTFEVLARDGNAYINMPIMGGWIVLSAEDLGGDYASLQELLSNGSFFDYGSMVQQMAADGKIEHVGQEEIDGHNTVHYRVAGDLQSLIAAFSGALGATGDNAFADQILSSTASGPITLDLWLGTEDLLPYKMTAKADISAGTEAAMAMELSANFGSYNESVTIPEAPAEAKTFAEVFGELGIDPEGGE